MGVLLGRLGGDVRGSRVASEHRLSLGSVVAHVLLGDLGGVRGVLAGNLAELSSLGVDNVRGLLEVVVDELLVAGVDQRDKEEGGRGNQSKAPVGDNLDQVVGEEGSDTSLSSQSS